MIINIQGTDIELTDALKQYAHKKIEGLTKYFNNIQQADIDLGRLTNHHKNGEVYYAEVNLHVPHDGGNGIIRMAKQEEDLYKAIDKVKDHMKVELDRRVGKMREKDKAGIREKKAYDFEE